MEKKYPIGGYAPGCYECKCCTCGNQFTGDKRAVQCEPCAEKGVAEFTARFHDQIIANQVAGMPLEEAIFQAGYTAGVDFQKARQAPTGAVWVKGALPPIAGDYYCKCKVDGEDKKLIVEFDKNGQWGEAPGYDYYETFDIAEWLDESGTANSIDPDELWDEFSEATDHGIVMTKEGWRRVCGKLKK